MAILAVVVLVVVALIGWCVWRFCKKKRPKGNEKDKKGKNISGLILSKILSINFTLC